MIVLLIIYSFSLTPNGIYMMIYRLKIEGFWGFGVLGFWGFAWPPGSHKPALTVMENLAFWARYLNGGGNV